MDNKQKHDILVAARRRIEIGWIQNKYYSPGYNGSPDRYCVLGAIGAAEFANKGQEPSDEMREFFRKTAFPRGKTVVAWNDTKGRQKDEVLAAFDKAINTAERKAQWERRIAMCVSIPKAIWEQAQRQIGENGHWGDVQALAVDMHLNGWSKIAALDLRLVARERYLVERSLRMQNEKAMDTVPEAWDESVERPPTVVPLAQALS